MVNVAHWGIHDAYGKLVCQLPYNLKDQVQTLLAEINSKLESKKHHFCQLVKTPLDQVPRKVAYVLASERHIRGMAENKKTGERHGWMKTFIDLEVVSLVDNKFVIKEHFTTHYYKGELRVKDFGNEETFIEHAKKHWPTTWEIVIFRLRG